MIARHLADGSYALDNGLIGARFRRDPSGAFGSQEISVPAGAGRRVVLRSDALLLLRGGGYSGLTRLAGSRATLLSNSAAAATLLLEGAFESWSYRVTFRLQRGSPCLDGRAAFKSRHGRVGWVCYALTLPRDADCWAYPWVMADRLRLPTNIGREIGVSRPNHIWAKLAGVPALTWRSGGCHGLLGFPLDYDYRESSLTYNPEAEGGKRLGLGWGLARGFNIEDANEEYAAGREYSFPFQVVAGQAGFQELAREWCVANRFSFDGVPKYTVREITEALADGRRHERYRGQRRYVSRQKHGKRVVSGYQSGSDDNRIIVDLLPRQACTDFGLYQRTGNAFWLERV